MRDEFRWAAAPSPAPEFAEGVRGEQDKRAVVPTLVGHVAVFNRWAEIDGLEGHFLERIAPGAFARTLARDRAGIRILFQHGQDPTVGSKPLGRPTTLREDAIGLAYEVEMFDTSYNLGLIPGLRADQYGASFRFQVIREALDQTPTRSAHNPARGAEERPGPLARRGDQPGE